ncbi:MAG: type II toxin-antitoxin system HicA family toxin [Xanthomonadaceae bacterium]|nr:type II toxin-antitoxin system HicA family toxin [Xanthomonadaceae bacterium]
MKRKDLESELSQLGWWLKREGGKHSVWTNGVKTQMIPRHKEINEFTAKGIMKSVKMNPVAKVILLPTEKGKK